MQLTHRANYARADKELGLTGEASLEWHAENALDPAIAAVVLFTGMAEGWFTKKRLDQYFSATKNDSYNARSIVNGDRAIVPSWSNGVSIGKLIAGYHKTFLAALQAAYVETVPPVVVAVPVPITVTVTIKSAVPITITKIEAIVEAPEV